MTVLSQARALAKANKTTKRRILPRDLEELRKLTGFSPRSAQEEILGNRTRFRVDVCHRRFGKSVLFINLLVEQAYFCPFPLGEYAYAAPTYDQAKRIAWKYLFQSVSAIPDVVVQVSDLSIVVPTHIGSTATIRLFGLDSPKQRLRGSYLDGCVLDETAHIPRAQWTSVLRPMLADVDRSGKNMFGQPNQWVEFIGTPNGRDWFCELYERSKLWQSGGYVLEEDDNVPGKYHKKFSTDWSCGLYKASQTGIIPAEELQAIRTTMDKSEYEQEFECSFEAAIQGAIFADALDQLEADGGFTEIPINPALPVSTAFDLGWDDATAIWFFQQVGDRILIVDYFETNHTSLPQIVRELDQRSASGRKFRYGYHLMPHDVHVTELGLGKTRKRILEEHGMRNVTAVRNIGVADLIAAARRTFPRCLFSSSACAKGIAALRGYHRRKDERLGVFSEKPVHDRNSHAASAFQTLSIGVKKVWTDIADPHSASSAEM